ncbi:FAD-binding oxidoreductase [Catenuloplanes sp. NPDC051500]|uniref:FAD-binding oxidoreductase n=1 Tax=Catenuloplanes sp. NPDC051500 TaxID=3363959 RepID=UPI0037873B7C
MFVPFLPPGTPGYAEACASFQLAAAVEPAGAFTARTVADVVRAVGVAREHGMPLRVHTTGHAMGRTAPVAGPQLLVRPLIDEPVRVDPIARTAVVPAGKRWADVLPEANRHGLTAVHGSSATVGVVGYLLGGGISFYGRLHGVAANTVRAITLVRADGTVVTVSPDADPELFWALRGGGGGFGVVVAVEIDLVPMHRVITGMAVWDAADAARIAPAWQSWAEHAPEAITTSLRLLNVPPMEHIPALLRGRRILAIDGAAAAPTEADLPDAQRTVAGLLDPLTALAEPILNTWGPAEPGLLPLTHMDPADPLPFASDTGLTGTFTAEDWPGLLAAAGSAQLLAVELRQLGGAFARPGARDGAFGHTGAPLLYWSCGLPGEDTIKDLQRVRDAIGPRFTGYTAPTFVDHVAQQQRTFGADTVARVAAVRSRVDPDGLFAADVQAIRDITETPS